MRFRGKDDGDDANDGGGSVADRGFMTRGLLAVPYSEAAISREAQAGSPERKKNHPTGFRPQPSSSSAPGHGCEDYNGDGDDYNGGGGDGTDDAEDLDSGDT